MQLRRWEIRKVDVVTKQKVKVYKEQHGIRTTAEALKRLVDKALATSDQEDDASG